MPRFVSQKVFDQLHSLSNREAFVWLYEIEVPTDPPTRVRLVGQWTQQVTFRGNIYYPYDIVHSPVKENTEGNLSEVTLNVANMTREVQTILEDNNGLIGQPVRFLFVSTADLGGGKAVIEQDFTIRTVSSNNRNISMKLAVFNLFRARFPSRRLKKGHCRFKYRSAECGYVVPTSSGGLATCDQSLDGPNGCEAHGTNELDNGFAVIHPKRFGGFPGIPRQQTTGGGL